MWASASSFITDASGSVHKYHPDFAIDGLISNAKDSVFISEQEQFPWFQVRLDNQRVVSGVAIYSQVSGSVGGGEGLKDIQVRAGTEPLPQISDDASSKGIIMGNKICGYLKGQLLPSAGNDEVQPKLIWCSVPITADHITVQSLSSGRTTLQINEIEVMTGT